MEKIKTNKIQCNFCKDIIESVHRHDFKSCFCGRVSVDGGKDYMRCDRKLVALAIQMNVTNSYDNFLAV